MICDVFTDRALAGNPLAVFTDARHIDTATMQALARETNLSETTFVLPPQRGGHARVRIFTPTRELPFAGHPTLGTAFVLGAPLEANELRLELGVGVVPVKLEREAGKLSFGWMTQPVPRLEPFENADALMRALGREAPQLPLACYDNGAKHVCVGLESPSAVAQLSPDFSALSRAVDAGVCVFHYDGHVCKARYFAPYAGVPEDPATGSAAGPLALHLQRHRKIREGQVLQIDQGAEIRRPSTLFARVDREEDEPIVQVGGAARIVGRGQFSF